MSGRELVMELEKQWYAAVPFPLSHKDIDEAVATFFNYLSLPQEQKEPMRMKRPTDQISDIGYVRAKGEKGEDHGTRDFKEYFHYHPDAEVAFADVAQSPTVRSFFDAAASIYAHADEASKSILRTLDTEFPGLYDAFFPEQAPMERILRFLKYEHRGAGKFLARAHYDRGGCTLALAESAPGLRIGKDDATLTPVVHQEHTAIFMPAYQFPELTGGRILPAWHDVVQASDDVFSENASRWAVVFFVNAPKLELPSSAAVHTVYT